MKTKLPHVVVISLAVVLFAVLLFSRQSPEAPRKGKVSPVKKPQWYLVNKASNQTSTAYTEAAGAPASSSARPYFVGGVAVHPRVPGGSHLEPIIPFGTTIKLINPKSINIQGREIDTFTVIDTGDADWGRYGDSPYWVDFYYGVGGYWSNLAALKYGQKKIDYYWYEPLEKELTGTSSSKPSGVTTTD